MEIILVVYYIANLINLILSLVGEMGFLWVGEREIRKSFEEDKLDL